MRSQKAAGWTGRGLRHLETNKADIEGSDRGEKNISKSPLGFGSSCAHYFIHIPTPTDNDGFCVKSQA